LRVKPEAPNQDERFGEGRALDTTNRLRARGTGRPTLAEQVFDWLTEQIISGALKPGDSVSEYELAARLGVSRAPVRDALRTLARDRVVDVRPQRGTYITELTREETEDLYRARQLVEPEMARLAIRHATDADLEAIGDIVTRIRRAELDPPALMVEISSLWHFLMELCPNRAISDIAETLWRRSMWYRGALVAIPKVPSESARFAERFLLCAQRRDAVGAKREMAALFRLSLKMLIDSDGFAARDESVSGRST
jgi:DNA-binding GntR family transcriptional regulator